MRSKHFLHGSGTVRNAALLLTAHTAQYLLSLLSWIVIGRLSFSGRMDRAWLGAWALLLFTLIPFRIWTTRLQGSLAIGLGGFLKRRLLAGALKLGPEEVRDKGIGSFLGQAFEAEAVETLALGGGIAGVLATVELGVAGVILGQFAIVLALWCALAALLGWWFLRRYQRWMQHRMNMTHDLVESMVGHRTRLAQQPRDAWHREEDDALETYVGLSRALDRTGARLVAAIPRGWLLAGLACIAPNIIAGKVASADTAIALGGVLLAFAAFKRLAGSFTEIAVAAVAWKRVAPLFEAAARKTIRSSVPQPSQPSSTRNSKIIEADRLTFQYRNDRPPAVHSCSMTIRRGDRILLEGPSGGGKTTLASLLSGLRTPNSGLLLINGFDRHSVGDAYWRERVAAAPQFHENYILTETLAFNLLMGRAWPPERNDLEEAETICRELGLGPLLDTMPSGLMQMVGEGGWQLSHGERSRVFIARALLQNADLVILDESFGALDPQNLKTALECTLRHARTLLVIAHP